MSDNSEQNGTLSMSEAMSLLETPPVEDKVDEGRLEETPEVQVEASAPETETEDESVYETEASDDDDDGEYELEEGDEEEVEEQPEVYTVKVDGEEFEVTQDELLSGYSRTKSFTKRSMELAEQRKAFEQEAAQVKQMRDMYAQQLEQVQGQLQQAIPEQEPDWAALAKEYPAEDLIVYKAQLDQQKEQARHVEAERQRIQQEQAQEQQVFRQKHLEAQRVEMLDRIPAWSNEDTRNAERQEVIKYAQSRGFSQEETSQASDARAIELLYKAWQWDNLQKKTPAAKKKAKSAPKMAKAGQPKSKAQVASRQRKQGLDRLNNERSVDAAVSYLMGN